MVKPKYLVLVHCKIEILLKRLVCGKDLFNLGGIIRKLDFKGLTVSFRVRIRVKPS